MADADYSELSILSGNFRHLTRTLDDVSGVPAVGNVAARWEAGERWGYE